MENCDVLRTDKICEKCSTGYVLIYELIGGLIYNTCLIKTSLPNTADFTNCTLYT